MRPARGARSRDASDKHIPSSQLERPELLAPAPCHTSGMHPVSTHAPLHPSDRHKLAPAEFFAQTKPATWACARIHANASDHARHVPPWRLAEFLPDPL